MGRPRPELRFQVLHEVRRAARREFKFPATDENKQLFGYVLAYCLERYNMDIYAFCAMTNHLHRQVGDRDQSASRFRQTFHSLLSRAMAARDGTVHESLFDTQPTGVTIALDPDAAIRDVVYIALNPVRAGIIRTAIEYEGFTVGPWDWGVKRTFERPNYFFKDVTKFKDTLSFTAKPPPGFQHLPLEEARQKTMDTIALGETQVQDVFEARGWRFGQIRTRKLRKTKTQSRSRIRPNFKSRCPKTMGRAQAWRRNFHAEYNEAKEAYHGGDTSVLFPVGTDLWGRLGFVDVRPDLETSWYRFYRPPPGVVI